MSFDEKVWVVLRKIPRGKVATYKQIAIMACSPKAFRAVGNACNKNPYSPQVPCHRVVCSSGKLGGYAHGTAKKARLLRSEGIKIKNNKIDNFEQVLMKEKEVK